MKRTSRYGGASSSRAARRRGGMAACGARTAVFDACDKSDGFHRERRLMLAEKLVRCPQYQEKYPDGVASTMPASSEWSWNLCSYSQ
jgi:hypothetical protein